MKDIWEDNFKTRELKVDISEMSGYELAKYKEKEDMQNFKYLFDSIFHSLLRYKGDVISEDVFEYVRDNLDSIDDILKFAAIGGSAD